MTNKIDFTKIAEPVSNALDTDFMDIYRQVEDNPERDLLYSNVPCHIAIKSSDNANPETVDVKPIIVSLRIHCGTWVDIKNNDYIVAKKCDLNGNVLNYYEGVIGEPATSMARQFVDMKMSSAQKGEEPEPVPTENKVDVTINYFDDDNQKVKESIIQSFRIGDNVVIKPSEINNYSFSYGRLNGETVIGDEIRIDNIKDEKYIVDFYYEQVITIKSIRILVNGDYTKDNGIFAYGLHLYAPINVISSNNNSLVLANNTFEHEDMGIITIKKDDKFKDNFGNWHIITAINPVNNRYNVEFTDTQPVQAYETHWYD